MLKMINKKYMDSGFQNEKRLKTWLEKLNSSNSLSKVKFLFYFLEKAIRWDDSFANESECAICGSANNEQEDVSMWIKAKCFECDIVFHLNCLKIIQQANPNDEDGLEIDLFITNCKNERIRKAICYDCNLDSEKETILEEENFKNQNLNSIEKGSHSLRFNRARVKE
jgi:hypothetical protein